LIGGCSVQPDLVTALRTSTGAPHDGQLVELASDERLHHGQV